MKRGRISKSTKQIISLILLVTLIISIVPLSALAEWADMPKRSKDSIVLKASSEEDEVLTVKNGDSTITDGDLALTMTKQTIERDYDQKYTFTVKNTSEAMRRLYFEIDNKNEDVSMEIVGLGSKSNPLVMKAEEEASVSITIFAQNAESSKYTIPVNAYEYIGSESTLVAEANAVILCDIPELNFEWKELSSEPSTLAKTISVTNKGNTITDVTVSAQGELADYVSFNPAISNYQMDHDTTLTFSVAPDLAKMKNKEVQKISGSIVAKAAGKTSIFPCTFDTNGKDISTISISELANKQNGYSISKFEPIIDTMEIEAFDGEKYTNEGFETSSDILDNNDFFSIRLKADYDVGLSNPLPLTETITTQKADSSRKVPTEPTIEKKDNGNIVITSVFRLSASEYHELIKGSTDSKPTYRGLLTARAAENYNPEDEIDTFIHLELPVGFAFDLIDVTGEAIVGDQFSMVVPVASLINDGFDTAQDIEKLVEVRNDPNINLDTKLVYYGLGVAKQFVRYGLPMVGTAFLGPAAGLLFSFGSNFIDLGLELFQQKLLANGGLKTNYSESVLLSIISGFQCMNRGIIDIPFFAPKGKYSDLYVSSRMYRGNDTYVNQEQVNYYYYLNGKPAGKSQNAGLTDYNISKISTENIVYGSTNTISTDYDVMPGHYWLNTDTTVTLIPDEKTEIGYIGNIDKLPDVRNLPDFIINPENIYTEGEAIIGKPTKLYFKAYNIGGYGGWITLKAKIDGQEVEITNNHFMDAFSAEVFTIPFTPTKDKTDLEVALNNTSVMLDERNTDNNNVTKTITARNRIVPVLGGFVSSTNYTGMENLYYLEIKNITDISSVDFELDGLTIAKESVSTSVSNDVMKCCVSLPDGIEAGDHNLVAKVNYETAGGKKTIEKAITVGVNSSILKFKQEKDYESPSYAYITDEDSGYLAEPTKNQDGTYSIQVDKELANNLKKSKLVISYNQGLVYAPIVDWDGTIIKHNPSKVNFVVPAGYQFNSLEIRQLNNIWLNRFIEDNSGEFEFSPGEYDFTIELISNETGKHHYVNKHVTVADKDISVDLENTVKEVTFNLVDPKEESYEADLYVKQKDSDYYRRLYLDSSYNGDTKKLLLSVSDTATEALADSKEAKYLIKSDSELFVIDAKSTNNSIALNSNNLKKITYKHKDDVTIGKTSIEACNNDFEFEKAPIYLSDGSYDLGVFCQTENQGITVPKSIELNKDTEIDIAVAVKDMKELKINYDKKYSGMSKASVGSATATDLKNGVSVYYNDTGIISATATLLQDEVSFEIRNSFDSEKKSQEWNIGDEFEGSLYYFDSNVETNESFNVDINYLKDKYDNSLTYFLADDKSPLTGYAELTNVKTKQKEYVKVTTNSRYVSISAPDEEGEYTLEVYLFTNSTLDDSEEPKSDDPEEPKADDPTPAVPNQPTPFTPDSNFTGLANAADNNGVWWYYTNGKIDKNHTGVDQNKNGWWRVENGKVNFKAQGIYQNKYGWWKTTDGEVTFKENSIYQNEHGWWKCKDSKVDFNAQSIYQNKYGWWKTTNGKVTFKENSVYQNENGWWKCNDSKVNFNFTGIARNKYGVWYIRKGKVDFSKTGTVKIKKKTTTKSGNTKYVYRTYNVKNGKVMYS